MLDEQADYSPSPVDAVVKHHTALSSQGVAAHDSSSSADAVAVAAAVSSAADCCAAAAAVVVAAGWDSSNNSAADCDMTDSQVHGPAPKDTRAVGSPRWGRAYP